MIKLQTKSVATLHDGNDVVAGVGQALEHLLNLDAFIPMYSRLKQPHCLSREEHF